MDHSSAIKLATNFIKASGKRWKCSIVFSEMATSAGEEPDLIGFCAGPSTLVECKVSRSDFHADKKKLGRMAPEMGMGNLRYYACPKGLLKEADLPDKWGLVYLSNNYRRGWKLIKDAELQKANQSKENLFIYSALRRFHENGECKYLVE